jgi:hypothetical protein
MILTAYFDESGTHGADVSAMAGFVGDARQWRKFGKRALKLFQRFHVNVFHAIDVRRTDKDFRGWQVDRKIEFLDEFQHVINETLEGGVAAFLKRDDYLYYSRLNWPTRTRKDSAYGLLFRACLSQTIDTALSVERWANTVKEPRLYVVLEDGHRNAEDVRRIYNFAQNRIGQSRALAGLKFETKRNCVPLAAADLFAYTASFDLPADAVIARSISSALRISIGCNSTPSEGATAWIAPNWAGPPAYRNLGGQQPASTQAQSL